MRQQLGSTEGGGTVESFGTTLPLLLTTAEVARMCRVHPSTVLRWRQVGEGPPVIWVSSHIPRYAPDQVTAWLERVAP